MYLMTHLWWPFLVAALLSGVAVGYLSQRAG